MTDHHSILGLVMPTNEPETAFSLILPSLHQLKEISSISTFLINFQHPWTPESVEECVKLITDIGFKVKYKFSTYDASDGVPFNLIRSDTCDLMPEAKFFALIDDDMTFRGPSNAINKNAGQQYVDIIHYMMTHPRCGIVLIGGTMVKRIPRNSIAPISLKSIYQTGKGLIVRNMYPIGYVLPFDSLESKGAFEERIAAGMVLYNGYYPAKLPFGRINHYENTGLFKKKKFARGEETYQWKSGKFLDNLIYVKEHYNPNYIYEPFEKGLNNWNIVEPETYVQHGGTLITDEFILSNTVDYSNSDFETSLNTIKSLYDKELES